MSAVLARVTEPPAAFAPACIEVERLGVRFGALSVIEDLSFTIRRHEFVSLLGPSGCGKSTLLRAIAGLVPTASGAVRLGGQPTAAGLGLSIMFQKPLLLPWRTTLENVLLPVEIELDGDKTSPLDAARAERILALVRLQGFEGAYPHQLSGGMQQRVALARALISDPEVLLLDEPFGALDEMTRNALNQELLGIWRSENARLKTVVMVTHSIQEAVSMSDRVLVLAARPARLRKAVDVGLPHPRDCDGVEFSRIQGLVRQLVRSEA